jgi:hypothetical protein
MVTTENEVLAEKKLAMMTDCERLNAIGLRGFASIRKDLMKAYGRMPSIGAAYEQIKTSMSYAAKDYNSFSDFVKGEVSESLKTVERCIIVARVHRGLKAASMPSLPDSQESCIQLHKITDESLRATVWKDAIEKCESESPNIGDVNRAIARLTKEPEVYKFEPSPDAPKEKGMTEDEIKMARAVKALPKDYIGHESTPIKPNVAEALATKDMLKELTRDLNAVMNKVKMLMKNAPEVIAYLNPINVNAGIRNAIEAIKCATPHAPCVYCEQLGCEVCTPRRGPFEHKPLGWLSRELWSITSEELKRIKVGEGDELAKLPADSK